jgi:hypothetical protein
LVSVDLPEFVQSYIDFICALNASLVSFNAPNLVPFPGQYLNLGSNALNAASVNQVLARCVANSAYTSGVVDVSGGTSSPPTGQGITDAATLVTRGVTVTTN